MIKFITPFKLTGLLLLLLIACSPAKDISKMKDAGSKSADEIEIRQTIVEYYNFLNQKKVKESMEYIHPKLFEIVPKELMVEAFEGLFTDSMMTFSFDTMVIRSVVGPIVHDDTKYAKVNYLGHLGIRINDEPDELTNSLMEAGFKQQFGKSNVTFDPTKNEYKIKKESAMIAIREKEESRWGIIENNKEYKELFEMFIPKEVAVKLKL